MSLSNRIAGLVDKLPADVVKTIPSDNPGQFVGDATAVLKELVKMIIASVKLAKLYKPESEQKDTAREIFGEYSSDAIVKSLFDIVKLFF